MLLMVVLPGNLFRPLIFELFCEGGRPRAFCVSGTTRYESLEFSAGADKKDFLTGREF